MARRALLLVTALLVLLAIPWGCSASSDDPGFEPSGQNTGGTGAGDQGTGGLFLTGGANTGGGNPDCLQCSADLHQVLDCDGNLVKECPADQGCAPDGSCVSPCESASLNKSSIGCDFFAVQPGPEYETRGSCYAALVANTWTSPLTITAEYAGTNLDVSTIARVPVGSGASITYQPLTNGQLEPGQIAVIFLSAYPSGDGLAVPCPAGTTAGIQMATAIDGTTIGNAFHLTTSAPIVAYDIFPYGGAASFVTSATLLVPTPTWGDNYIAADAYAVDPNLSFVNGLPHTQIVASQDGTNVTISPTAAIVGGAGVTPTGAGQPMTYTLNRGQVLQFMQNEQLVGSPISADKPISVWGGSGCMNIPVGQCCCESAHQQLLPVKALGSEYVGARYRDRVPGANESTPYLLIGGVDGTTLTWDPAPPAGAPTTLASGQSVMFSTSDAFAVKSQDVDHPFYVAAYQTGAFAVPGNEGATNGDPEFVNVIPAKQYLSKYLFLTDPTYRNTNLVFTRVRQQDGSFEDVNLDCLGAVGGWQPIGSGQFEFARVDLVVEGVAQGACDNGVHTATSDAAFGLTVWGWDVTVSYAYPAGMSVEPINTVVVPPDPK